MEFLPCDANNTLSALALRANKRPLWKGKGYPCLHLFKSSTQLIIHKQNRIAQPSNMFFAGFDRTISVQADATLRRIMKERYASSAQWTFHQRESGQDGTHPNSAGAALLLHIVSWKQITQRSVVTKRGEQWNYMKRVCFTGARRATKPNVRVSVLNNPSTNELKIIRTSRLWKEHESHKIPFSSELNCLFNVGL